MYNEFDYEDMDRSIDAYKSEMTTQDILRAISNGSHMYFVYLQDLISSSAIDGNLLKANVYESLEPYLSRFIDYWHQRSLNCSPPAANHWTIPLSSSWMDFPAEIQLEIIAFIPVSDLLNLRVTSKYNRRIITPLTHCRLRFRLPPSWTDFTALSVDPWQWAASAELLGAIFIAEAWFPIYSVSFESWPIFNYCIFKFLPKVNVTKVSIIGFRCANTYYPHIPYPFMLPPTVKHLSVARCSLMTHSVLGLLSPGTMLESLEIDHIDNAHMHSLSDYAAAPGNV
ncbi:uncharacterized protein ARMOST_11524 [Armillaria ostoyae]|uniref:F-box domain-containing protein n=1 Tax=Armillaria ostoyae TaxID=47428 RepID=A0A284RHD6_ARMOS|nr:uncharacterized protein ARMOST_11524 [Armillaria ostoyae]